MRIQNKQLFLWTLRGKSCLYLSLTGIVLLILMFLML